MSDEIKELLKTLIKGQEKLVEEMEAYKEKMNSIDERISKMESQLDSNNADPEISPALVRAVRAMIELDCPCSIQDVADHLKISRSVVSMYLNQLERTGHIVKIPSLEKKGPRFFYDVKIERFPVDLRAVITKSKRKVAAKQAAR